jgi:hypothetical protein
MSKFGLSTSYGWLLLLVMLTNVVALAYFFKSFLGVSRTRALLAGAVFYVAWLASFSSPGDSIYWLTGAMEYQLSISNMLIIVSLLCKSRHTIVSYIVLAVLAIAIPAQHEIAGVFLFVCLLGGVVAARVLKLELHQWLLCLGLAALSVSAIMFSPAMTLKMATHGHFTQGYVTQILPHAKRAVHYGIDWVLKPAVLLSAFCIPLLLATHENSESEYRPPRWLALAGIGAMCVLLGEFANAEMGSWSGELPPRAVGWFQFVFWFLLVCVVLIGVPEISKIRFSTGSRIGILTLLALSLLGSENFRQAEKDLRGPARFWHRSSVARLSQKGSVLQFDPLPPKPRMFKESGLSKSTGCWVNQCAAVYLGANVVSLKGPKENHWDGGNPCDIDPHEE